MLSSMLASSRFYFFAPSVWVTASCPTRSRFSGSMSSFFGCSCFVCWPPDRDAAIVVSKSAESDEFVDCFVDGEERASLCDSPEVVERADLAELPEVVEAE